jgi:DNA-binding SARP family transcriptional activator
VTVSHRTPLRQREIRVDKPSLRVLPPPADSDDLEVAGTVELQLLGSFGLQIADRAVCLLPHLQRLIAFLAVHERPLHRAYVSGRLWIDKSQEQANGSLRTTLWRLQRLPRPIVEVSTTHLSLHPSVVVDVRQLTSSMRRALRGEPLSREDVERLIGADDLLVDCYEDWVLDERDQLRQQLVLALEATCLQLLTEERHAEAVLAALAAMSGDRLRESAVRVLIEAHFATGNLAEALRRYDTFRAELATRFQLEPSGQLTRLVESIAPGYRAVHELSLTT